MGVVGDVRVRGLERSSEPQVYLPHRQVKDGWLLRLASIGGVLGALRVDPTVALRAGT